MASLKRIAADLGVSYTLVSKVLNDRLGTTGVSAKMRAAIINKARELEYTPNRLAVALKAGRRGAVGIFLHHFGSPGSEISEQLLRGLAEGLAQSGYRMWLRFFNTDDEFIAACDEQLKREVDGLIVAGVTHETLLSRLRKIEKTLPVVSVFCGASEKARNALPNVGSDYEEQGYLATRHLLDKGCRAVATFSVVESRHEGYLRAMKERGLEVSASLIVQSPRFTVEDGGTALEELVARNVPFDGIVCHSDAQAVGAINELVRRGYKVPQAVKVVGIDNSPLAEACIVPITSVTSGMAQSGLKAVELLLKKIGGDKVETTVTHSEVVERESTRP
ncbi:hypothetical protein DB346_07790 [Verrucomicrobia bacterium LW23]|nr:hypothetical protein DB346_07790 [Verrucomicrobia bacterium LW23]